MYAIGNPSGLSKTLTAGVVSGLNRTIPAPTGTRIYGAIQVGAALARVWLARNALWFVLLQLFGCCHYYCQKGSATRLEAQR